jgi:metal-responsive CopG/Arc/MetJ family transcriptional regulator
MRHRSVSQTFSLPLELVERIAVVCERLRINRSVIAREAIEKELKRYEHSPEREKGNGRSGGRRRSGARTGTRTVTRP